MKVYILKSDNENFGVFSSVEKAKEVAVKTFKEDFVTTGEVRITTERSYGLDFAVEDDASVWEFFIEEFEIDKV